MAVTGVDAISNVDAMACKGCTELIDMTPNFLNDCGSINLRNAVAQHLIYLLH